MTEKTDYPTVTFVTNFTKVTKHESGHETRIRACHGFYEHKSDAVDVVKENRCDIYEDGAYPLCVVETLGYGLYPTTFGTEWFEWDRELGGYQMIDGPPDDLKKNICFSIS